MATIQQHGSEPQPEPSASFLDDLEAQSVWLLWKSEPNDDPAKKPRKVPCYVSGRRREGALDSAEDRAQLVSYPAALAAYEQAAPGTYAGLGYVLGPDGRGGCVQGIDLDNIVAAGTTDIADLWTRGACAGLGYVEISPSGTGLHLIGYGRPFRSLGSNTSGIEAYAGGRFFTFTGRPVVPNSPCRSYDLADYVEQMLAPRHSSARLQAVNDVEIVPVDGKTVTELRSALLYMRSDDRDLWVAMGHALKELGDTGRGMWMDWSAASDKFDPKDAARTWDSFKPRSTGHQAVFARAQAMGWTNPASSAAQLETPAPAPSASDQSRRLVGRSLGGVSARAIEWLWTGWIPKGYITIFAGESGA